MPQTFGRQYHTVHHAPESSISPHLLPMPIVPPATQSPSSQVIARLAACGCAAPGSHHHFLSKDTCREVHGTLVRYYVLCSSA